MAILQSPGIDVSVTTESIYETNTTGTVPLIFVTSAENKKNGAGTGIAPGTLKANAGKLYTLSSQRDLVEQFGVPTFKTDLNGNPIHASELNEYGLLAAYSYLGANNKACVIKADINLDDLNPTPIMPVGEPEDNTLWLDYINTQFGIHEWNNEPITTIGGQTFTNKIPIVITNPDDVVSSTRAPRNSIGKAGDYALVATSTLIKLWYKTPATAFDALRWVEVGTSDWKNNCIGNPSTDITFEPEEELTIIAYIGQNVRKSFTVSGFTSVAGLITAIKKSSGPDGLVEHGFSAENVAGNIRILSEKYDFKLTDNSLNTGINTVLKLELLKNHLYGHYNECLGSNIETNTVLLNTDEFIVTIPKINGVPASNVVTIRGITSLTALKNRINAKGSALRALGFSAAFVTSDIESQSPTTIRLRISSSFYKFELSGSTIDKIGLLENTAYGHLEDCVGVSTNYLTIELADELNISIPLSIYIPTAILDELNTKTNNIPKYPNWDKTTRTVTISGASSLATLISRVNNDPALGQLRFSAANIDGKFELQSAKYDFQVSGTLANKVGLTEKSDLIIYPPAAGVRKLVISPHTDIPTYKRNERSDTDNAGTGSIWIKSTAPNNGANWNIKRFDAAASRWNKVNCPLFKNNQEALDSLDIVGRGLYLDAGQLYIKYNDSEATPRQLAGFKIYMRKSAGQTISETLAVTDDTFIPGVNTFTIQDMSTGTAQLVSFLAAKKVYTITDISIGNNNGTGYTTGDIVTLVSGKSISDNTTCTAAVTADENGNVTDLAIVRAGSYYEVPETADGEGINVPTTTDPEVGTGLTVNFTYAVKTVGVKATNDILRLVEDLQDATTDLNIDVSYNMDTKIITFTHIYGGEIKFVDGKNFPLDKLLYLNSENNLYRHPNGDDDTYLQTLWASTINNSGFVTVQATRPIAVPLDNTMWYNSIIEEVDIMINTGTKWVGYRQAANPYDNTDPNGPLVSAVAPIVQSDGTPLVNGDLWIDSSDLENYPVIRLYNEYTHTWNLIDNTDKTSEYGIVFADARWATSGAASEPSSIVELLVSDYLDPDAPLPTDYPRGTLLWNTRRSGFNVKQFKRNYIDLLQVNAAYNNEGMGYYYPHRWVTASANDQDGVGVFGRKSQRKMVVQALQKLINNSKEIREKTKYFNLLACPAYPELIKEMVNLNNDLRLTAFVVGDSPARLQPDLASLNRWGKNVKRSKEDNDAGLVTHDDYLGVYYPWGYTTDTKDNNVVVPPSHMILKTIALSDSISYPWFAFSGVRRGKIINASAIGYVNSKTGDFVPVVLDDDQRDVLADIKVNPITYLEDYGLVNMGNITRSATQSTIDRVNVARLVIYLRRLIDKIGTPFLFEQNDKILRDELKNKVDSALLEILNHRGIYDFVTVCDKTNNTPARIARQELWLDIGIEAIKGVEFIYVPLRLKNPGTISELKNS